MGLIGLGETVFLIFVVPLIVLYIVPGVIATYRHHPQRAGIWLLNVLGGWTGVGWIAALIWALLSPSREPAPAEGSAPGTFTSGVAPPAAAETSASEAAPGFDTSATAERPVAGSEQETNRWAFLLHLSLLAGHIIPFAGFIAPIVIWQTKKDALPGLDAHGRNATNWIISQLIYAGVAGLLVLLLIGLPLLFALAVAAVVFPIVAAVKASDGKLWRYPMALPILR